MPCRLVDAALGPGLAVVNSAVLPSVLENPLGHLKSRVPSETKPPAPEDCALPPQEAELTIRSQCPSLDLRRPLGQLLPHWEAPCTWRVRSSNPGLHGPTSSRCRHGPGCLAGHGRPGWEPLL